MIKVFLDTPPIIYFIEKHPRYYSQLLDYLTSCVIQKNLLETSVLSVAEFEIKPRRINNLKILKKGQELIDSLFDVHPIDMTVAKISGELRSRYRSLKAIDSLQLATAIGHRCDVFVTNDRRLRAVKEIEIKLVTEL
ncbi:MAG: PIN domain-containing protein [Cyclobacteriaceae bacterium]|jgi:predicted nucleic acid-binding protein|nr:PIN domain-containing protein [Cyclobacteriaceae bacterium]